MPNLDGTGPMGQQNWGCRRGTGNGAFKRSGCGRRNGKGMFVNMQGAGNQQNINSSQTKEAVLDNSAIEINTLKEKVARLETMLNEMKSDTDHENVETN
ncbi:MAG: DUF5320 domain-containing protein [Candidatus Wallbacteria bacterium]